jgi:hypothetical protein
MKEYGNMTALVSRLNGLAKASRLPLAWCALAMLGCLLMAAGPAQARDSVVVYEGSFDAGEMVWDQDANGGFFPVLPGTNPLQQPGQPQLPARQLMLLVPLDWDVSRAWVEPLQTHQEKTPGALGLAPALAVSDGSTLDAPHMKSVAGVFPATWGEFQGTHTWRGYRLLTLSVHPVQSRNSGLEFLDQFAVHVEYAAGGLDDDVVQRQRFVPGEEQSNAEVLSLLVDNPEQVFSYARQSGVVVEKGSGGFNPSRTPSLSGSAVDFLIVTNEEMADEFQVLADHKTAQGLNTLVATREFIAANYRNGADIQETIRMFIRDAYQKWGTEYVLLGGDTDVIPARIVSNDFYPATGHTDIPADIYFACLDGNWNANGNAFYGEPAQDPDPGDEVDFAEEVYLGRATVSSAAAAQVFVNKTMRYENTPAGAQWPARILYASEVLFPDDFSEGDDIILDGAQFSNQMINELVDPCTDMNYLRMYETDTLFPRDLPLTKATLIDSLNTSNYGIVNQIGHGFYFNMSVGNGNFLTYDADALVNTDSNFMLFSLNCASCAFDYSCLMERFLQNPNGGSVISIGSSRAAFPNTSNNYQQEFFDQLYCQGENRVGRLVALSRLPFLGATQYNYVDRWTFENYTLLGDPSLPIWTGSPLGVDVSATALQLGPNTVTVTVQRGDTSAPIEGAFVCLQREGEDYASGYTGPAGTVILDYLATGEGTVELTVTGRNLALTQEDLTVTDGTSYLRLQGLSLMDDGTQGSSGNGNGVMESGETLAMLAILEETAGSGASGLTGTLTCDEPLVSFTTATASFSAVSGGGVTVAQNYLIAELDPSIPDGTPVTFTMTVTDGGSGSWVSEETMIIKAPELEAFALDWEDVTYGNGDDWPDSGERLVLSVKLKNYGAGRSNGGNIYLRSDNINVAIYDSLATFPAIEHMETGEASALFSLALVDNSRNSKSYLAIEDEFGRIVRHEFALRKPEAPSLIETDPSLGADVIALRWAPSESEDVYGYNVFRSTSPGGPFTMVNPDVVAGVAYYRDENLDLLTRYYYKIVTVGDNLVPSQFSDVVQQATAPAEASGFPVEFSDETSSHLAVGDVDGDGDEEIILVSDEIYVWHHDGSELLDGDGDSQTLGKFTDLNLTLAPAGVALSQLDDQPGLEIVICDITNPAVHVFGKDGNHLPGWPQSVAGAGGTTWIWATPAVGDIDGDGDKEIVANALNGVTWAWHADGSEVRDGDGNPSTNGFFKSRPEALWEWGHSSPALYDLDGDGAKDIIFGSKSNSGGSFPLFAWKYDGTDVAGFPYLAVSNIDNSPALGDLNNDGVMEIVFYDWSKRLYAVQADGTDYPGFPVYFNSWSNLSPGPSAALGDMDGDGELEIAVAANMTGDLARVFIYDTDVDGGTSGSLLTGWPQDVPGASEGSPVLGDIDGDGGVDLLFGIGGFSEDAPNNLYAFHADGNPIDGFPITLGGPLMPSPVITDLDHDSDVDIVMGGWDRLVHVWDMPFAYDRHNVPWPTFRGNRQRDGVFFPLNLVDVDDEPEVVPTALMLGTPYPNPFNPSTKVRLYVPGDGSSSELDLAVYDLQGRLVRVLHQGAIATGWHTMVWDGKDSAGQGQASGLYFMRARTGGNVDIRKMTLVK